MQTENESMRNSDSVRLDGSQKEAYLNNYSGAGTVETQYRGFPTLTQPDESSH